MCISMPVNIQRCTRTLILQTPSRACRLESTADVTLGQTSSSNASSMMMDTAGGGAFEPASTSVQPAASARRRTIKATLQQPQPFALIPIPSPAPSSRRPLSSPPSSPPEATCQPHHHQATSSRLSSTRTGHRRGLASSGNRILTGTLRPLVVKVQVRPASLIRRN